MIEVQQWLAICNLVCNSHFALCFVSDFMIVPGFTICCTWKKRRLQIIFFFTTSVVVELNSQFTGIYWNAFRARLLLTLLFPGPNSYCCCLLLMLLLYIYILLLLNSEARIKILLFMPNKFVTSSTSLWDLCHLWPG